MPLSTRTPRSARPALATWLFLSALVATLAAVVQQHELVHVGLLFGIVAAITWLIARKLSAPLHELARRLDGAPRTEGHTPFYREADLLRRALDRLEARHLDDAARSRELNAELEERVTALLAALELSKEELTTAEREMGLLARTDRLTGLPNRYAFDERLLQALARSRRSGLALALFFLDVDKFKSINDTHGHAAGDEVLREFARRLTRSVRETDTVARLAGDEFVVILESLHEEGEAHLVATKIMTSLLRPFQVDTQPLPVTASIGVAYEQDATITPADLLAHADAALYKAKAEGRDTFCMATA